jgi:hypothetical protein
MSVSNPIRIQHGRRGPMSEKPKPTHTQPGGFQQGNPKNDDGVVNDSFGTVDPADSTGLDENKETGDAKRLNKNTRED